MSRFWVRLASIFLLLGGASPALAIDRSPGVILGEIDSIKLPEVDPAKELDEGYVREIKARRSELRVRRADLIGELRQVDPANPRLLKLLPVRWRSFSGRMAGADDNAGARDLTGELDGVIARPGVAGLDVEAAYIKAKLGCDPLDSFGSAKGPAAKTKAAEDFIAFAPKDERGAELLALLSISLQEDPARQKAVYERIVAKFPGSKQAKMARGRLGRIEAAGKKFDLAFDDAIGGRRVSMQDLRGKIVVVDFWATWCGPCVADLPRMKALYSAYHPSGVEFIGISLDYPKEQGGLDQLKAFVAKNEIPWPQYYQGDGFDGEFSTARGITSIPAVFLVDRNGDLVSVDAGEELEALIAELLDREAPKGPGRGR